MTKTIEVITRGVFVKNGMILLCRTKGAPNTYLPGGHVEFEEKAAYSLRREIREELGVDSQVGRFLGAVENSFLQNGARHCEINIVFSLDIPALNPGKNPVAVEHHVEFSWVSLSGLSEAQIEPSVLCGLLPEWISSDINSELWGSAGH